MKKFTLLLFCIAVMAMLTVKAQTTSISGTVTSAEDGRPIPGVTVLVKGTTLGTVTNVDGKYTLYVPDDNPTLIFSFVGLQRKEVPAEGTKVNVTLQPDVIGV